MYDAACADGFTLPEALQDPTTPVVLYPHALNKASDHDLRVCAAVLTATAADAHPPALVFVDAKQDAHHKARLAKALASFADRVYVFPRLPTGHFYQVLRRATLVLDAYPHGGFHTSLEAMYFGKVVVTRPSAYLRGRYTQGFYKRLGMVGPIAADEAALVDRTVGLVRDAEHRSKLETHIGRHAGRLFNEVASVREWEDTLVGVGLV
jgi:predicted O-linked N-acetylglucosamine transferase (SPINDLY family)